MYFEKRPELSPHRLPVTELAITTTLSGVSERGHFKNKLRLGNYLDRLFTEPKCSVNRTTSESYCRDR